MLETFTEWLAAEKDWVLSGIGLVILSLFIDLIRRIIFIHH